MLGHQFLVWADALVVVEVVEVEVVVVVVVLEVDTKVFVVELPKVVNISWSWCLLFVLPAGLLKMFSMSSCRISFLNVDLFLVSHPNDLLSENFTLTGIMSKTDRFYLMGVSFWVPSWEQLLVLGSEEVVFKRRKPRRRRPAQALWWWKYWLRRWQFRQQSLINPQKEQGILSTLGYNSLKNFEPVCIYVVLIWMSHLILLSISTISLDAPSSFSDASTLENEDTFLSLPKVHHLIITCTTFSCEVFQLESVTFNIYFWARVKFSRINAKNCPFCVICQILARDVEGFQKKMDLVGFWVQNWQYLSNLGPIIVYTCQSLTH